MVFDLGRVTLTWAALHNLAEWGVLAHLIVTREKVTAHALRLYMKSEAL